MATFYAARSEIITPLPWPTFALPFSGLRIFTRVREQAFIVMKLEPLTALLPPGRQNSAAVARLGFAEEDPVTLDGVRFRRFRLRNPAC